MSTRNLLSELLSSGLIQPGDVLYFTFKNYQFRTQLMNGGILARCKWKQGKQDVLEPCFTDRQGFASLTDWCDSCIQEMASEYVTRFSSWKRVKHQKTGHPMSMLRDELRSKHAKRDHCATRDPNVLERLLANERRKVVFLEEQLHAAKRQKTTVNTKMGDDNPFRLHF